MNGVEREEEIPELMQASPLDDIYIDLLMSRKRESSELDFKYVVDISKNKFADIAKDIFAMANYGGGYILIGFKEKENGGYEALGVPEDFHIDQADLQQKFNAYSPTPIVIGYKEFERNIEGAKRKFALVNVPPSTSPLLPTCAGNVLTDKGKTKTVFNKDDWLIRRGTQSIIAAEGEKEFIRWRAAQCDYQISLISGNPDRVPEMLYSNIFEVKKIPDVVFSAQVSDRQLYIDKDISYVLQNPYIYSFESLSKPALKPYVIIDSIKKHYTKDWFGDKDKRIIIFWLLDKCLINEARSRGMFQYEKKLYYPLREGEVVREVPWAGMVRKSNRQVAKKMYIRQLSEEVGIHPAVDVHFIQIVDKLYLQLTPTYVLTHDGRRVRRGEAEGTVITRLSHDDYNKIYLRNLLFWMEQLGGVDEYLKIKSGLVEVSMKPVTVNIDVGINSDKPSLESLKADSATSEGGE